MRITITVLAAVLHTIAAAAEAPENRWSAEKVWRWYDSRPWLVGCNFLPSTAVNDVEMWQEDTFDARTIDRDIGWAEQLGFNTVRVFVNFVAWREDGAGLLDVELSDSRKRRAGCVSCRVERGSTSIRTFPPWSGEPLCAHKLRWEIYH